MNTNKIQCKLSQGVVSALAMLLLMMFVPTASAWNWSGTNSTILASDVGGGIMKIVRVGPSDAIAVMPGDPTGSIPAGRAARYTLGAGWSSISGVPSRFKYNVAANDDGDYIIAGIWADYDLVNAKYINPVLRVDLSVDGTLVSNDFPVSTNLPDPSTPAISGVILNVAVSQNNDAIVVWNNGNDIRYRMYRNGSWGADSVLDTGATVPNYGIDVAADDAGNFTVVWQWVGSVDLFMKRFKSGVWSARESTTGLNSANYPRVTMWGNNGEAMMVWSSITDHRGIFARRFNGTSWQAPAAIDAGAAAGTANTPQIASNQDGTLMVVFKQGTTSPTPVRPFANRYSSGSWEGAEDISCSFAGQNFNIDIDKFGNAAAAFASGGVFVTRAYQVGLGWLGCYYQGLGGDPGASAVGFATGDEDKKIAITPHEIFYIYSRQDGGGPINVRVGQGEKDVYINGFDTETTNPIVDLNTTLPYDDICFTGFTEMRFSNDGVSWSPWEAGPPFTPPYQKTKSGWDITDPAYGGNSAGGLKRAYIQFRNATCQSLVTHDEIMYTPPAVTDLAITKTDTPDPVWVGDNLVYDITVNNYGPDGATGVTVTDHLPASVSVTNSTPSQGSCSPPDGSNVVTCSLGSLAASANATVSITVVPGVSGDISNTADVSANEPDSNGTNNSATEVTTVLEPNTPPGTDVVVNPDPDITLTFSEVTDSGDTTVTSSATNPGPTAGPYDFHGLFYDFNTTATYNGTIEICFTYDDTGLTFAQELALRILHLVNGEWVDVTTSLNTTTNVICGTVTSLSWFGVGEVMDTDGDGVGDDIDNCTLVANTNQRDTNGDGYGNVCDPDLNNDGLVNFGDLALLKSVFGTAATAGALNNDADMDGDGYANFGDLAIMKSLFAQPPGPSGLH